MAIWIIIRKAIKIWFALRALKLAKTNAYRVSRGLKPIYTCWQIICGCISRLFKCIFLYILCWPCVIKWKGWKYSLWDSLWISGTFPNETLKSLTGLLCGLICSNLTAIFLIYSLNISPAFVLTCVAIFGTLFTLALAFTQIARCFAMLAIPPLLFSKQGRVALLGYILVLALSGPGKNTAYNMEVLTESLVCSEEMANNATGGLIDLVRNPTSFLGKAIKIVVAQIKEISQKILGSLTGLMRIISSIVDVILTAYKWLESIVTMCNSETGTPFERCWSSFETGIADCQYHLPTGFKWLCEIASLGRNLCYIAKVTDVLCWLPALAKEALLEAIKPIKSFLGNFVNSIKTFFVVGIHFDHEFSHSMNSSKSFKEIVHDMKAEIMNEISWLLQYVDWMDLFVSLFFLYGFAKAIVYRHRFLQSDRYDNSYITKGMVKLDWERKLRGREYIFPLKYRESRLYVDNYSFKLLEDERKVLKYSMAIVLISSGKILSYLLLDALLFLFLELLRKYGAIQIETEQQVGFSAKIIGTGFLADMYRGILHALTPVGESLPAFDTTPCLPIAREPNYWTYLAILSLILFVILGTLAEPYGMRSRHMICEFYYPERTLPRDRWIYFHILNSRGNFFTFAKNQLLARVTNDKVVYRFSLIDRFSHTIPCFHHFVKWMGWEKKACFLCGKKGDKDDFENFFHCPKCQSVFCLDCYQELENECPLDSTTIRIDKIDEEMGSDSDDDNKKNQLMKMKPVKVRKENRDSKSGYKYSQLKSSADVLETEDDDEGSAELSSKDSMTSSVDNEMNLIELESVVNKPGSKGLAIQVESGVNGRSSRTISASTQRNMVTDVESEVKLKTTHGKAISESDDTSEESHDDDGGISPESEAETDHMDSEEISQAETATENTESSTSSTSLETETEVDDEESSTELTLKKSKSFSNDSADDDDDGTELIELKSVKNRRPPVSNIQPDSALNPANNLEERNLGTDSDLEPSYALEIQSDEETILELRPATLISESRKESASEIRDEDLISEHESEEEAEATENTDSGESSQLEDEESSTTSEIDPASSSSSSTTQFIPNQKQQQQQLHSPANSRPNILEERNTVTDLDSELEPSTEISESEEETASEIQHVGSVSESEETTEDLDSEEISQAETENTESSTSSTFSETETEVDDEESLTELTLKKSKSFSNDSADDDDGTELIELKSVKNRRPPVSNIQPDSALNHANNLEERNLGTDSDLEPSYALEIQSDEETILELRPATLISESRKESASEIRDEDLISEHESEEEAEATENTDSGESSQLEDEESSTTSETDPASSSSSSTTQFIPNQKQQQQLHSPANSRPNILEERNTVTDLDSELEPSTEISESEEETASEIQHVGSVSESEETTEDLDSEELSQAEEDESSTSSETGSTSSSSTSQVVARKTAEVILERTAEVPKLSSESTRTTRIDWKLPEAINSEELPQLKSEELSNSSETNKTPSSSTTNKVILRKPVGFPKQASVSQKKNIHKLPTLIEAAEDTVSEFRANEFVFVSGEKTESTDSEASSSSQPGDKVSSSTSSDTSESENGPASSSLTKEFVSRKTVEIVARKTVPVIPRKTPGFPKQAFVSKAENIPGRLPSFTESRASGSRRNLLNTFQSKLEVEVEPSIRNSEKATEEIGSSTSSDTDPAFFSSRSDPTKRTSGFPTQPSKSKTKSIHWKLPFLTETGEDTVSEFRSNKFYSESGKKTDSMDPKKSSQPQLGEQISSSTSTSTSSESENGQASSKSTKQFVSRKTVKIVSRKTVPVIPRKAPGFPKQSLISKAKNFPGELPSLTDSRAKSAGRKVLNTFQSKLEPISIQKSEKAQESSTSSDTDPASSSSSASQSDPKKTPGFPTQPLKSKTKNIHWKLPSSANPENYYKLYYEDELDSQDDEDGTCHHHQDVDEDVYEKYSDVVTELETMNEGSEDTMTTSSGSRSSSEESTHSSSLENKYNDNSESSDTVSLGSGLEEPRVKCCGSGGEKNSSQNPDHSGQRKKLDYGQQQQQTSFQGCKTRPVIKPVNSGNNLDKVSNHSEEDLVGTSVAIKIQKLNSYYSRMPFPPHNN